MMSCKISLIARKQQQLNYLGHSICIRILSCDRTRVIKYINDRVVNSPVQEDRGFQDTNIRIKLHDRKNIDYFKSVRKLMERNEELSFN